jgi:hypothetical protein
MPHAPGSTIGLPFGPLSRPIDWPVEALNALIAPSPKLLTSTAPLIEPKFAGACAMPQGAFSDPPVAKRCFKLPAVS